MGPKVPQVGDCLVLNEAEHGYVCYVRKVSRTGPFGMTLSPGIYLELQRIYDPYTFWTTYAPDRWILLQDYATE